jgi:hypothetical protein
MTPPACPSYAGFRFPAEIISYAVFSPKLVRHASDLDHHLIKMPLGTGAR